MITLEKNGPLGAHFVDAAGESNTRRSERPYPSLLVDARMLFASGIGRYLREIISRWPEPEEGGEAFVHNTPEQREWLAHARPGSEFIATDASIYSLREQFLPENLPSSAVYWVPHYNLPWRCPARLVATVHDAAPLVLKEAFPRVTQRLAAHFYFGIVRRKARRILAVSEFTANELVRHAGVRRDRIEVVANGVSDDWLGSGGTHPRDAQRLLFVGNLKAHKNLGRLLDAIEIVRSRTRRPVTLDVIGQAGGFRAGLEARTEARLRTTPWIRLHGKVNDAQLRAIYASAGALVFPSLYEGFGLPMLEAMAAGCPVISSQAGALPEIGGDDHRDGGGVIYFDPRDPSRLADRLEYFWRLPAAEHLRMAEWGRRRAALFSWNRTARATHGVLREELARARAEAMSP